ncbi:MAG: ABC transporter permease [Deltaproteobacteria bacterium]|nr:ABC transporter permease [Deltaproteobacteria bacterium]
MKHAPLIFANLFRKKTRTILTIGSFTVALFLFGLLVTIRTAFVGAIDVAGADRIVVINKVSLIQPLPLKYRDQIKNIDGVKDVTYANWFGGIYIDERNFFPQMAIDSETFFNMYPEFVVPKEQLQAFLADRQGAIAGISTAERYGWKIGDRIPIKGTYITGLWEFNLRGIYKGTRPADDTTQFWFHHKYLEENGPDWMQGIVGWYVVRVNDPQKATEVVKAIDEHFANSPWETKTDTEKAFIVSFVKQMGDIESLILVIGAVVFFTLLLVAGNTMAMTVRERINEIAVLKTIGFSNARVLGLILIEPVIMAFIGGVLGIAGARAIVPVLEKSIPGFIFVLPAEQLVLGVIIAMISGLLAGLLPSITAQRLRVVDALRKV